MFYALTAQTVKELQEALDRIEHTMEKSSISSSKVMVKSHCSYFKETFIITTVLVL